jgi:hypothetical protein
MRGIWGLASVGGREYDGEGETRMPVIAQFFGIKIRMFYNDHAPPHFHAVYGEFELVVGISPIRVLWGEAPARVRSMVIEWAGLHQEELVGDWVHCRMGQRPDTIDPLL